MGHSLDLSGISEPGLLPGLDPVFLALSLYRRRHYERCATLCSALLERNPYDEAIWSLKTRALTEQVQVDDVEADEEGIVDVVLDDNSIRAVPRPGTSLKPGCGVPGTSGSSQAYRPSSQAGRPVSGVARPGSAQGRPATMEAALRTPRSARTARPVSATSGRFVRLGTASMLSQADGPFINLARLNVGKYSGRPALAKALFEYIFHHENSIREAMELAAQALVSTKYEDWWWKVALGKCYYRLGMLRDAEKQFKSAVQQQPMVATFLMLAKVCTRLDQPLAALEVYRTGLDSFPNEVCLLVGVARIQEALGNLGLSAKYYKTVLAEDSTHVEAIACIGMNHFYSDQPELSLRFYRRLLQMGIGSAELYNNLGLCCFFAQQYDMTLTCFQRALATAEDETLAEVWYNVGHLSLGIGDVNLAYQCFRLALTANNDHAESYNNIGVLEMRKGHVEQARAFFQSAASLSPHQFECHYNYSVLSEKTGDLQTSYMLVQQSLASFPGHSDSKELLAQLATHFQTL